MKKKATKAAKFRLNTELMEERLAQLGNNGLWLNDEMMKRGWGEFRIDRFRRPRSGQTRKAYSCPRAETLVALKEILKLKSIDELVVRA